ncbi:MAG: hypothetical protein GY761_13180 [Hyphomicrobiales bacterium]|nr:hypothetical protein [Hyphomicrobiales bacterium]
MQNLGSIITTVALIIAAVYLLDLGPTVHAFALRLFHVPQWRETSPLTGLLIRAMYLVAILVVIRIIIGGVRRND